MQIDELLQAVVDSGASDLHISADFPPLFRIDGILKPLSFSVLSEELIEQAVLQKLSPEQAQILAQQGEVDLVLDFAGQGRFRGNIFKEDKGLAGAFRFIPKTIPKLKELGVPQAIPSLLKLPHGLILVTGPTGSGKSTTLASMIDDMNRTQARHILTLEDPIEYLHKSELSLVHQRQIGRDTASFGRALRAVLRQDPDVILIGEMRDAETVRLALTAAETGHLVLASLHTASAVQTLHRILDIFSGEEKVFIQALLSVSLKAVLSQILLPKSPIGRVAAFEFMRVTPAIAHLIREGKIEQIKSYIETGQQWGMQTLEQHLKMLDLKYSLK